MEIGGEMKNILCVTAAMIMAFSGAAAAEEITVVGTGNGMALLNSLGKAFMEATPDATVVVPPSIGSSGGIKAVGRDEFKIGRVARPIKDKEQHFGLTYLPFAKIPVVFFTHPDVGVADLTTQQICDIYSGKIDNWKAVGGKDGKIRVIRREDGDSSLLVLLASFPGFKDISLTPKSKTTFTDQETLELTARKEGTIAFGNYINAKQYDVTVVSIEGKKPTNSDYPCTGTLALIFKEINKTGVIAQFVDFATSPTAQKVIIDAGGLGY
jgi:phosphate transport system substrate-binding protein